MATEEGLTVAVCLGTVAGVMPGSLVEFMEETFIVPSGPWGDTRRVEHFGGKTEGDVLPPWRV